VKLWTGSNPPSAGGHFSQKITCISEFCSCVNEFGLLGNISLHNLGQKVQKVIKCTIFKTKWGYFGLAGTDTALCRTCLPGPKPEKIKSHLLKSLLLQHRASLVRRSFSEGGRIEFNKTFFKTIQEQIVAYFEGVCVNFSPDIPVMLDGFSTFCTSVLTACRYVNFGQTITYAGLAKRLGRPKAARAVGNALAKNPLPLIIPCHRVVRSDGSLGGFSAPGGKNLKVKLLTHEEGKQTIMVFGEPRTRPASFLLNETVGSKQGFI